MLSQDLTTPCDQDLRRSKVRVAQIIRQLSRTVFQGSKCYTDIG